MTLVRFTPMRDLMVAQNRLNRIFDSFFDESRPDSQLTGNWLPETDIEETKDALIVRTDLPGMTKDDLHISVEDNQLIISGERKSKHEESDKNFHRVERTYGTFYRRFALPATVMQDRVEASYKDGVLEITIPKAEEVKPREIEIKM